MKTTFRQNSKWYAKLRKRNDSNGFEYKENEGEHTYTIICQKHCPKIEPTASFSALLPQIIPSSAVPYFVKVGSPLEQGQYAGEAESLKAIEDAAH